MSSWFGDSIDETAVLQKKQVLELPYVSVKKEDASRVVLIRSTRSASINTQVGFTTVFKGTYPFNLIFLEKYDIK